MRDWKWSEGEAFKKNATELQGTIAFPNRVWERGTHDQDQEQDQEQEQEQEQEQGGQGGGFILL